jgi:ureidoacrylate peracid hydrolase
MKNLFLDPQHTALMIIDVQNDFCHENGFKALKGSDVTKAQATIPVIEKIIDKARSLSVPIVFVYTTHSADSSSKAWLSRPQASTKSDLVREGTWGAEFYRLSPQEGDIIIEKHSYCAFMKTNLEENLIRMGIKSLIIAGVATNLCVESTARNGFMLDYNITLVKDGCAGYFSDLEAATYTNIQNNFGMVLESKEIEDYWSSLQHH